MELVVEWRLVGYASDSALLGRVLQLVLLQVVVQLWVYLRRVGRLKGTFGPWVHLLRSEKSQVSGESVTYLLGESELLLNVDAIGLQLLVACVADVRGSPATGALLLQRLHLVIQILLLVHVLVRLVHDRLRDAPCPHLLLVVLERRVDPPLLTGPHVRAAHLGSIRLPIEKKID